MRFRRFSAFPISAFCLAPKIVQKKVKKKLTGDTIPAKLSPHTVTTTQNTTLQMKIKTLAIAAATLAVGAITSQAQVYSQNIVGYVNGIHNLNGKFECLAVPFDATAGGANPTGNTITNLFAGIAGGSVIQLWNGSAFVGYKLTAGNWINQTTLTTNNGLVINPGTGIFLDLGGSKPYTNTIAGQIVVNSGSSVTNKIYPGLQLVGSEIPFGDSITNTATINLIGAGGNVLEVWDPVGQSYVGYKLTAGYWINQITLATNVPNISVGQGFFYNPGTKTNTWVQVSP
jgi:hypothetical protein